METLKIIAISDLHGYLPKIENQFDILLICGDICPAHDHYYTFQKKWIENVFIPWVNNLPFNDSLSKVVLTWGNHDFIGETLSDNDKKHCEKLTNHRLEILKNEVRNINTLNVGGTPYCKIFGNWAFMLSDDKLKEKFHSLPKDLDILITHDSPSINELGTIHSGWNKGTDAGNKVLDEWVMENTPKYLFSGHIHSGNHTFEKIGQTYMANVSYVDEKYEPYPYILGFEIDKKTKELVEQYPILLKAELTD